MLIFHSKFYADQRMTGSLNWEASLRNTCHTYHTSYDITASSAASSASSLRRDLSASKSCESHCKLKCNTLIQGRSMLGSISISAEMDALRRLTPHSYFPHAGELHKRGRSSLPRRAPSHRPQHRTWGMYRPCEPSPWRTPCTQDDARTERA